MNLAIDFVSWAYSLPIIYQIILIVAVLVILYFLLRLGIFGDIISIDLGGGSSSDDGFGGGDLGGGGSESGD